MCRSISSTGLDRVCLIRSLHRQASFHLHLCRIPIVQKVRHSKIRKSSTTLSIHEDNHLLSTSLPVFQRVSSESMTNGPVIGEIISVCLVASLIRHQIWMDKCIFNDPRITSRSQAMPFLSLRRPPPRTTLTVRHVVLSSIRPKETKPLKAYRLGIQ